MKKHKAIRFFVIILFLVLQTVFLTMIVKEKYDTGAIDIALITLAITCIMWFAYKELDLHHEKHAYDKLLVVVWVPIGALACYALNIYAGLGSVISASTVGTIASFVPIINKSSSYLKKLPAVIYCGTFIGMSSTEIAPSIGFVLSAGIFAGVLLLLSKNLFLGIGGKLGTIAFAGVVIASLIYWILK
ncbi:hypothetical protein [Mangrovimonas cancribranchiae]|uniref:Uncharacterized protein n=1 Tax=Mangrovimonas cancribranchiae TaxID=3080055 RepID=A0AAU6NXZ1_9FLAO